MAKLSKVVRNEQRRKVVEQYRERRATLRARSKDSRLSLAERQEAQAAMSELPRLSIEVRLNRRCLNTGRVRGVLRDFQLCRHEFRRLALLGQIPGVLKASW